MNTQERRVYLALALCFLALIASSATSFFSVRELVARSDLVNHTHQVRSQLGLLLDTHQDLQIGQRGYVITGNRDYLKPYELALVRADTIFNGLVELVRNNEVRAARLRELDGLRQQHLGHSKLIIETRRLRDAEAARQMVADGDGKRIMDALRSAVAQMDAQEGALLIERAEEERRAVARLNGTLLASFLFAMLVLVFGGAVIHRDFAHRRRAEAAIREQNTLLESRVEERTAQLRDSEARLRLLIEGVRDYAIVMVDPHGRIMTWNDGAERIYGYATAEILGQPMSCFFLPEDAATRNLEAILARAAIEGRLEEEGRRLRKDGTQFPANAILTPLRDAAATLIGFAMVTRDITERERAMDSIRRHAEVQRTANEELARFNRSMVDRELRMIELKEEINELCSRLDQPPRYVPAIAEARS